MATDLKETSKWWFDLAKVVVTAGTIALLGMRGIFATKEELEMERDQRRKVSESVLLLTEQRRVIQDFEDRIRTLEHRNIAGGRQIDGTYDK